MLLAIEFAAARITTMTLPELEAALDDRFAVLGGGRRPSRQRTLHGTLDWSYDLLSAEEQRVLRTLGVFLDGFDADSVAGVADLSRPEAIGFLDALLSKSWITRRETSERARFGMQETVKAYAEDRLAATGETRQARDRHLNYFHGLATSRGHTGMAELRLGVKLRAERGNLTAAFEWAATTERWSLAAGIISGAYPAYVFEGGICPRSLSAPATGARRPGRPRARTSRPAAHRTGAFVGVADRLGHLQRGSQRAHGIAVRGNAGHGPCRSRGAHAVRGCR
jgi:predicted ATPase